MSSFKESANYNYFINQACRNFSSISTLPQIADLIIQMYACTFVI